MAVPMALMVALDMALADLRMVLDKALQPESSVKVLALFMLAAVEEPVTKNVLQVKAVPEAAVQVALLRMASVELVAQEEQTSVAEAAAEVKARNSLEVKAVPAS